VDRGDVLERLFSVHSYSEEDGVFLIAPNRLGFGVIGPPLMGGDHSTSDQLARLVNLPFPAGAVLQFTLFAAPDLEEYIARFRQLRANCRNPILRAMTEARATFLREAIDQPVDRVSGLRLHNVHAVLTWQVPFNGSRPGPQDWARVRELRDSVHQTLKAVGFGGKPLTPTDYLRFMQVVFNHGPEASWRSTHSAQYDDTRLISHQILDADTCIDVERDGLWLGKHVKVRTLSPKAMPEMTFFGMAQRYIGDYLTGQKGIREPVLITLNVIYPDQETLRGKIETDRLWTQRQAESRLGRLTKSYGERRESLELVATSADAGHRLVHAYLGVAVFGRTEEESQSAAANAVAFLKDVDLTLCKDEFIVLPLFFQLLPFAADPDLRAALMRYRTTTGEYVADMAPVMGTWRGTGTPLLTLISRDGQPMAVSPHDNSTNASAVVVGESGSGKSFMVNEMIANLRATDGRVWVIDIGYSYKKMCSVLGGQYIDITPNSNLVINPFDALHDLNEEIGPACAILELMAAPKEGLSDYASQSLQRVVAECARRHGGELTIDRIADALLADADSRVRDIGQQLHSFRSDGIYGRYFNGPCNIDLSNPLIVIELENLKHHPLLQRVVLMSMMFRIEKVMYGQDKSQRKLLVCDECWQLLGDAGGKGQEISKFLVGAVRRARKANGSVVFASQSLGDFYANPSTVPIVENAGNKYLLKQSTESIAMAEREGRMSLGDWGIKMLRSVHTVRGEYSEVLCVSDRGMGVGRLVVNEFTRLMYSTNPAETVPMERYVAQGMTEEQAIHAFIADRKGHAPVRLAS
jgi:conjugal transfer ATP-binding protein TraC